MTAQINPLRIRVATAPATPVEGLTKTIDTLAAEAARLQTNELYLDLSNDFVTERGVAGATINWTSRDFGKWLTPRTADFPVINVAVGLCYRPTRATEDAERQACNSQHLVQTWATAAEVTPVVCANDPDCGATIIMREPVTTVMLNRDFRGYTWGY